MAAVSPRREQPPRPDAAGGGLMLADRPPIAALFLIEFDVKAGYTIAWKQAAPGLDLSGAVEYKSLPSGLHAVAEDLIYFVHEDESSSSNSGSGAGAGPSERGYAGLSAFVNLPTDEADARYARMIAVGVLVPRSYGRLGRAWRHAEALMAMARKLAADRNETPLLEVYWRDHSGPSSSLQKQQQQQQQGQGGEDLPLGSSMAASFGMSSPTGLQAGHGSSSSTTSAFRQHARKRSASDGTALLLPPGHRLSPHHPAWSLTALLDAFGPLVFPIYRAALLRKRILISTHAPVREVNDFVYNISVLANIPISVFDILEPAAAPQQRIRPLFTIGVNDIPFLMDDAAAAKRAALAAVQGDPVGPYGGPGWVACTTDSILAMKGELWDVLITMPPARSAPTAGAVAGEKKVWPTVEAAKGVPIKATQRDLRRFRALTIGLSRLANVVGHGSGSGSRPPTATGLSTSGDDGSEADAQLADAAESVVEPVTWAALAYNGFMWWASAGEQHRSEVVEESIQDASLLADLTLRPRALPPRLHRNPHQRNRAAAAGLSTGNAMHDSLASLTARRAPPPQGAVEDGAEPEEADAGGEGQEGGGEEEEMEEDQGGEEEEDRARTELAIIAYFHRLTTQMLSVMADIVESGAEDDDGIDRDRRYYYDDDEEEEENDDSAGDDDDVASTDGLLDRSSSSRRGGGPSGNGGDSGDDDVDVLGARPSGLAPLPLRRRGGAQRKSERQRQRQQQNHQRQQRLLSSRGGSMQVDSDRGSIRISSDALTRMGLDVWSHADVEFVRDVALQYFGRRGVQVEGKGIEICGLKIC